MSIASELNRLLQAKADLKAAIEAKGVTVPAATTIDGYAALVDSISGGGVNIFDEMRDNINVAIPNKNPYQTAYAFLFNFEYGKTYKVIVKCRHATSGGIGVYCYQENANKPNVRFGTINAGEQTKEFIYTHNVSTTYTRCGIWVENSGERNTNYSCAIYIKEIG